MRPISARPTYRENLGTVLCGLWMVVGLFVDGWAHDNEKPETFFTPWHAILYSGFAAAVALAVVQVRRRHVPGRPWQEAIPAGQRLTFAALAVFGAGAIGDLVWHEVFGIEVGVEALLSPTHLLLLASGLLALTSPLRLAWTLDPGREPASLRAFLPPLLSLTVATALVGFFLVYLSPFVNDAAGAAFTRIPGQPHEHGKETAPELRQLLGVASILMTTVMLVTPVQLLLRRWRPPRGSFVVFFGLVVLLFVGLDEFAQAPLAIAGLATGLAVDALVRRRASPWVIGAAIPAVLWLGYFGIYQLAYGVQWTAELWTGVTFLAVLIGLVVSVVAAPPAAPQAEVSTGHEEVLFTRARR